MVNLKKYNTKMDIPFFLFFAGMFCLYSITIIQIALICSLGLYVILYFFKKEMIFDFKKIFLYFLWLGLLTSLAYFSKRYAYGTYPESRTVLTLVKCFLVGLLIVIYCDSPQKIISLLKALIFATLVLVFVACVTSPISSYGKAQEGGFGTTISQHRNGIGFIAGIACFLSFYLKKIKLLKYGYLLAAILFIGVLITGSRSGLIQCAITYLLYFVFSRKKNQFKSFIIAIIILVAIFLCIRFIPFLYDTIFTRLETSFMTIKTGDSYDSSTYGRFLYQKLAFQMFQNKPLLGYGTDGFILYFMDHPTIDGYHFTMFAYSHCNYAELLANYGIVGFVIWYWAILFSLIVFIKNRHDNICKMLLFLLVGCILLDSTRINWSHNVELYVYILIFNSALIYHKNNSWKGIKYANFE